MVLLTWLFRHRIGSTVTLKAYLARNNVSRSDFARSIGVTPEAVRKYTELGRIPTPRIMASILAATNGEVTANDFHQVRIKATFSNSRKGVALFAAATEPSAAVSLGSNLSTALE